MARLSWPGDLGKYQERLASVTHLSTNPARRRTTSLIRPTTGTMPDNRHQKEAAKACTLVCYKLQPVVLVKYLLLNRWTDSLQLHACSTVSVSSGSFLGLDSWGCRPQGGGQAW